jgi:predicted secreted protein
MLQRMNLWRSLILGLFALAFLSSSLVDAGDGANLEFYGFSKDGRYAAFEQFGTQDGSGFSYSQIAIVDVAKNEFVAESRASLQYEQASEQQARAQARQRIKTSLTRFKIVNGNQGEFIGIVPFRPMFSGQYSSFLYLNRTYQLELEQTRLKARAECEDNAPTLLELRLTAPNRTRVLQKDVRLPEWRTCALNYEMRSAHRFGNSLAVMIAVNLPSYEGDDIRWMMVTTKL